MVTFMKWDKQGHAQVGTQNWSVDLSAGVIQQEADMPVQRLVSACQVLQVIHRCVFRKDALFDYLFLQTIQLESCDIFSPLTIGVGRTGGQRSG